MPANNFRRIYLPYAIAALDDGFFLPLNRRYKPLGLVTNEHLDYEAQPTKLKIKGLTDARAAKIGMMILAQDDGSDKFYYLYEEHTDPSLNSENLKRYEKILAGLMEMEVSDGIA